jgi:hypothetical protein
MDKVQKPLLLGYVGKRNRKLGQLLRSDKSNKLSSDEEEASKRKTTSPQAKYGAERLSSSALLLLRLDENEQKLSS